MTAATTPTTPALIENPGGIALAIADTVTVYKGRLAAIRGPDHATSQGDVDNWAETPGLVPAGILPSANGLASAAGDAAALPPPKAALSVLPQILERVAVTGAASAADVLKPVYASDNATLTLTRPADDAVVQGFVTKWHTSTTCDVMTLGLLGQLLLGMAGGNRQILDLGHFDNAELANGNIATGIVLPFHGKFISLHGMVEKAFTGSGGTAEVNLEIGGTNVTGGVLTVSTAAGGTVGTKLDATDITAANVFHEGDVLDVEVANAGGTRTAGRVRLYAIVERLPGA